MMLREASAANTRRSPGWPRHLGAALAGVAVAASLAGCSLDASAFRQGVESNWDGAPDTLSASVTPALLEIPAIGVRSDLIGLQVQDDRTLEVPDRGEDIGWYSPDSDPEGGHPTVFVAHLDTPDGPAAFWGLTELEPGDQVRVTDAAGQLRVYRVDRVADHPVDDFPTLDVYGPVTGDEIRLLTCNGEFDAVRQQYDQNRVVYASRSG